MGCEPELLKMEATPTTVRKLDLPEGVPPLTSLYMYIAGSCNLACRHCWISPTFEPDNSKGQFLKIEYIKKAITESKPLGLRSVKLTGGEPLLHPQFRELVEWIDREGITISIETNGTLLDNDLTKFLKSKSKIVFISVSLDGTKAETHNKLRGISGSFEKTLDGIKTLVSFGFKPQVICTLHQGNIAEVDKMISFIEGLGCGSIKFNLLHGVGRGEGYKLLEGLNVEKVLKLYNHLIKKPLLTENFQIHFDIPIAFMPIKLLLNKHLGRCSILNILGILSNGDISLCGIGTTVQELVFGNLANDNIAETWNTNPMLHEIRELIPQKMNGICSNCIFRDFCLGNCIAMNYFYSKKINAPCDFCQTAEKIGIFPKSKIKSLLEV